MLERHYTPAEIAKLFSFNVETIRREAARGNLRFMRVGRDLRFPESAVREWCEAKQGRSA